MENKHVFGRAAAAYRDYRPQYPAELLEYLASVCARRDDALDCGTGSGQAAVGLAEHFARVVGCDFSAEQIAHAIEHPRVEYRVCSAEALPFDEASFDLITAAQGAHWFDLPAFYEGVRRVARPGAVLAIFGYGYCRVSPPVDAILRRCLLEDIEPYWAEGNRVVRDAYQTIDFPFDEIGAPRFMLRARWDRERFIGYLRTWSALARYIEERERDPIVALVAELDAVWPAHEPRTVNFDMPMRVGRVYQPSSTPPSNQSHSR